MEDDHRVSQLQQALLDQANSLARELIGNAEATRMRICNEGAERLATAEARERQVFQHEAERLFKRLIQSAEAQQTADLDRLRWALTETVLANVHNAMRELTRDPARNRPWLERLLADGAARMPRGNLVAEVNSADFSLLQSNWLPLCQRAAPERQITLACHGHDSLGGLCLRLDDNRVRLDQRIEARLERLAEPLAGIIMARLFAAPPELGNLHG